MARRASRTHLGCKLVLAVLRSTMLTISGAAERKPNRMPAGCGMSGSEQNGIF